MGRCCANCEWNISPQLEEAILEEQSCYKEDSFGQPMAGDCVLGEIHDENFYCPNHKYCSGVERIYALYDDKYAGTGFLIIHIVDDEIDKFFKISSCMQNSFPHFLICGCGIASQNLSNRFKTINFEITNDNELFPIFSNLAQNLNNKKVYTFDGLLPKKDNLQVISHGDSILINLNKDTLGIKTMVDYASINLIYNQECQFYDLLSEFYNNLSRVSTEHSTDEDIKKLGLIKRNIYSNF